MKNILLKLIQKNIILIQKNMILMNINKKNEKHLMLIQKFIIKITFKIMITLYKLI